MSEIQGVFDAGPEIGENAKAADNFDLTKELR
jgi:hypothetical protein